MLHLPTDLLVHEVFPLLCMRDLRCLDIAVSDQHMRRQLMAVYPCLRSLKHSSRGLDEHEMTWFFKRHIPLSSLTFSEHNTSDSITAIYDMIQDSGCAKSVKYINLEACSNELEDTHAQIVTICTGLESFHIAGYDQIAPEAFITRLSKRCTRLTTFFLSCNYRYGRYGVREETFRALGVGCPLLTHIDLSTCKGISEAAIVALTEGCPGLTTVNLRDTDAGDEAIIALSERCRSLTTLDLSFCYSITDEAAIAVAQGCPFLASLQLYRCDLMTDTGVVAVAQGCPSLTALDLGECEELTDVSLTALAQCCPCLCTLKLKFVDRLSLFTDECIVDLASSFSSLTHLDMQGCGAIDDASVAVLARECKSLTHLDMSLCYLTDAAVTALIQHCPTLTALRLDDTLVTDDSVLAIANGGLPSLEHLSISNEDLDEITDEATNMLVQMRPLLG